MTVLTVNVTIDLGQLLRVQRYSQKNQPLLIRTAAKRYLQFVRMRYILAAAGNGEWEPLKLVTIKRKTRRGVATNPNWILREYDKLLESLGVRIRGKFTYVGFVRNASHPRGNTITNLVTIHSKGLGTAPVRRVLSLPDNSVRRQMVDDVKIEYNKKIRQEKRK